MSDTDDQAFAGWVRHARRPWRKIVTGATEAECSRRLDEAVRGDRGPIDLYVGPSSVDPNQGPRPR